MFGLVIDFYKLGQTIQILIYMLNNAIVAYHQTRYMYFKKNMKIKIADCIVMSVLT